MPNSVSKPHFSAGVVAICSATLLSSGCASTSLESEKRPAATTIVDTALSKYAKTAAASMAMLASVQMAAEDVKTKEVSLPAPPKGLDLVYKRGEWLDDIESIVATIAADTGWAYLQPIGTRTTSVIVGVSALNKSAYDILREAGIKSGRSATIMVNVSTRELLVRYPDVAKSSIPGGWL